MDLPSADEVRKDRKKAIKHDAAHRLASALHTEGKDGVEAEWERSDDFQEAWMVKSRDMLARAEFRRRKLVQRLQAWSWESFHLLTGCATCEGGVVSTNAHWELLSAAGRKEDRGYRNRRPGKDETRS